MCSSNSRHKSAARPVTANTAADICHEPSANWLAANVLVSTEGMRASVEMARNFQAGMGRKGPR